MDRRNSHANYYVGLAWEKSVHKGRRLSWSILFDRQSGKDGDNMKNRINGCDVELIQGDITAMDTDAIVNAANERLAHGGGVAGAIIRKGGPRIQQESDEWVAHHGLVHTGSAAITGGGDLAAKYVIHAVGPVMGSGDEDAKLRSATQSALDLAVTHKLHSITFPAISTGIFGYPVERCAHVMLSAVLEHLEGETTLQRIVFCLFDEKTLGVFEGKLEKLQ
jgi:O-acetyl-ADP-ribose deacetylase (regulator of RNase III)